MNYHRHVLAAGLASWLCAAATAPAGPLDKSRVAADAKWVVHLDAQAAKESTLGRFALDNPGCAELRSHMAEAQEELGFDPVKVLLDTTAYGRGGEKSAVIVIHATKEIDSAIDKLKEKGREKEGEADGYREIKLGGHLVHAWKEDGSTTYAYFAPAPRGKPDERVVLISGNEDALKQGIDVLGGKSESLASGGKEGIIKASPGKGSILFGAAIDISDWAADIAYSEVMKKAQSLRVDAGELDGKLYADVELGARNEEDATNVSQMLQGAVAMVRMMVPKERPEFAPALDLASGLTFAGNGNKINIKFSYDSAKMLGLIKMAMEEGGQDHKAHHKPKSTHEKESEKDKDGD